MCPPCASRENLRSVAAAVRRRERGQCWDCRLPAATGKTRCPKHLRHRNEKNNHKAGMRAQLAERDGGWVCHYCGALMSQRTATLDRVIPGVSGGEYVLDNLVLACRPCNSRKGARHA